MDKSREHGGKANDEQDGARILVIDDEDVIHVSLRRILGRRGHLVDGAISAAEGLELMADKEYDLVITDLMMPEMDGIQLLERMKRDKIPFPVLMITGYPSIKTALLALRMGAVDYLAKPFTRRELLGPINRTLRQEASKDDTEPVENSMPEDADGYELPTHVLQPGDRVYLRKHSWAVYRQDGTVDVGIEGSFLENIGTLAAVEAPEENDLVEQGFVGFRLQTDNAEEHNVFMPLSGQVVEVNADVLSDPGSLGPETWVVRVLPDRLDAELPLLL